MKTSLFRYTNFASALDILKNERLTLLDPSYWDDRGDAHFISVFGNLTGMTKIRCLCLSEAENTSHHWTAYSNGTDGVSLQIKTRALTDAVAEIADTDVKNVQYRSLKEIRQSVERVDLPFTKRSAYSTEREVRIVHTSKGPQECPVFVPLKRKDIIKLTISPRVPYPLFEGLKESLAAASGYPSKNIKRSTIRDGKDWQDAIAHLNNGSV